jgi:adenosylcobyric acid synthase
MGAVIMVQGTASSVGKSVICAALCRIFLQDGLRVAPFKAQNMSNNSFVTRDGGEIGRAQALQAVAAGVEAETAMNPVLLKPEADHRSQVVLNGRPLGSLHSSEWRDKKPEMWSAVTGALDRLRAAYEVVVIEGAGSPAEVNIKSGDIVNMRVALHADAPVLLVGDIDRGGVFASLLGTLELLEPDEWAMVKGLIINRFRGDRAVLDPLPEMIEERTGVPVVGVVPYFMDIEVPEEDAVALESPAAVGGVGAGMGDGVLDVAVVKLPRVSNFDDFDPLARTRGVRVRYVTAPDELDGAHLVILPGTKSTIGDLQWMRSRGLDAAVGASAKRGAVVVGVCGGYQMLGESIVDAEGSEAPPGSVERGLGLLPVETVFREAKETRQVLFKLNGGHGLLAGAAGVEGEGYEIHMGETRPVEGACPAPAQYLRDGDDLVRAGTVSGDGLVMGTYVHGLFDSEEVRRVLLGNVASIHGLPEPDVRAFSLDAELDRLADGVRAHLDMPLIYGLIGR